MILSEKIVNCDLWAGTIDILTGYEDFKSEVEFDELTHIYTLNGEEIPSVTSLLDDGCYKNVDKKILENASKRGIIIHKEIETYLKTSIKGFTEEFYEFLTIYIRNKEKFENRAIFDVKTYSSNSPEKRRKCYTQTLMYGKCVEYLTGIKPEKHYEIWLPHNKKGKLIDLDSEFGGKDEYNE